MKYPVFVYGTLVFPEVRRALFGREPAIAGAEIVGYARYAIRSRGFEPFPVIVAEEGGRVGGLLVRDLDRNELDYLDYFENVAGGLYERITLSVAVGNSAAHGVIAYAAGPKLIDQIAEPWNPVTFRSEDLSSFMRRCFGVEAGDECD